MNSSQLFSRCLEQDAFKNSSRRREEADFGGKNTSTSLPPPSAVLLRRTGRRLRGLRRFSNSPCRHGRAWSILLGILLGACFFASQIRAQAFKEYDLKATFLYHLAQFVDWPPDAFPTEETPLVIGVLGADPFGKILDEIVQGEVVKNRKLSVKRYHSMEEITNCHILFISPSESAHLDQIFSSLKKRNILTVGDTEGFAQRGGMVRFMIEKNKIRLRINLDSAKAASLTISSKLLRAATLVGSKAEKP